ncbi:unnamed protein product [Laminaria digitata]
MEEDSRRDANTAPASLPGRERWQRARQAGVARTFGRVFRARILRRGLARVVSSRQPSSTTTEETFHKHADSSEINLQGGVVSRGLFSRWRRWRRLLLRSGHPTVEAPRVAAVAATATAAAAAAATAEVGEPVAVVAAAELEVAAPLGKETGPTGEGGQTRAAALLPGGGVETGGVVGNAGDPAVDAAAVGSGNGDRTDDVIEGGDYVFSERAARPATYDGEDVSPEAWAKVDEIRRRAESCDPKAGEAKGLQLWLASGGKGREGLTDTDILRFIMFRFGRADGVLRT